MSEHNADPRSQLPAVATLLEDARVQRMVVGHSRPIVLDAIRQTIEECRAALESGTLAPDLDGTVALVKAEIERHELQRLRRVINGTGIVLHTGLGRAVLPQCAVDALGELNGCCNVQIDLETGLRGKRNYVTERLLCKLTGAEAAMVVNNNAAATLLILSALCKDKEVIVSRGQLIEIGGSFRLPDCIHESGARLVEVGTTNKTHLRDYEQALSENAVAILRVNPSNYRIIGFVKDVPIADLASLKKKQPVLVIDDLGCGALVDLALFGLPHEPTVPESVAAGADIVCFSGDKLIGGPQSGIIVGKQELIARIKKHPLTRMLRVCKMTDLALERTLRLFLQPECLAEKHPTFRMLTVSTDALKRRARTIKRHVNKTRQDLVIRVAAGESEVGGGALPGSPLPTWVLALSAQSLSASQLSARLHRLEPPIISRIANNEVLLDLRTILEHEDSIVTRALSEMGMPSGETS